MRLIGHTWLSFSIIHTHRRNFLLPEIFLPYALFKHTRVVKLFRELDIQLLSKKILVGRYISKHMYAMFYNFFLGNIKK